jgi:hypothetical protein
VKALWQKIRSLYLSSREIAGECAMINVRRILFGAPFIACIHAALILMFIFNKADNDAVSLIWRLSLVITHSIMLVLMTIAFIIALYLNRKGKSGPLARFLQAFVMIAVLSGAIAITAIDQLVTTNVTAYILIQLAVGAALLVHPAHSFVYYFVSYLAYYFFVGLNNPVSDALFSNQINGLASAVLGFLLTYIMWRQNRIRLVQSNRKIKFTYFHYHPICLYGHLFILIALEICAAMIVARASCP